MKVNAIDRLLVKWRIRKYSEASICGIGLATLALALLSGQSWQFVGAGLGFVFGLVSWMFLSGVLSNDKKSIARYLSKAYPEFENSAELFVKNESSLTQIEQIQIERIESKLVLAKIDFPTSWLVPIIIMLTGTIAVIVVKALDFSSTSLAVPATVSIEAEKEPIVTIPSITNTEIRIRPPSYSGINNFIQSSGKIEALKGSRINWRVEFSNPNVDARIVFSDGNSLPMNGDAVKSASLQLISNDFYQVEYRLDSMIMTSELYPIISILDQGPVIELGREAYQEFEFGSISKTEIVAQVSDDYGLRTASIVATVAKGSGEGVKFREEVFDFDQVIRKRAKPQVLERTLSFDSLGLEPGDELYFYVVATDNMVPISNESRSETYFVALADTSEIEFSMVGNLGVDLMPQYFRSQRQLIIETEQLIKDKPQLSKYDFNFKSNELGYDQKVLRLKYGQFMGEEFVSDSGDGIDGGELNAPGGDEDLLAAFSHAHDSENDHNILEVNDASDLSHSHDNEEENTYFSMSVRTKLKEAMTQMWDAELYLRLYQPRESLPYQYKALELIKEIKNHARIYVQRMGFDPPPLKPTESRLKGKALDEVINSRASNLNSDIDEIEDLRLLMTSINAHFRSSEYISKEVWQNAGNELAAIAIHEPGKYFDELNLIQLFRDKKVTDFDMDLARLYNSLVQIVPQDNNEISKTNTLSMWNRALVKEIIGEK